MTPQSDQDVNLLKTLENNEEFDFWSELRRPGDATTIMVSPAVHDLFISLLDKNQIAYKNIITDVEE